MKLYIEYRNTADPLNYWIRWPEQFWIGRPCTKEELERIVEHHTAAYPELEYRIVKV